MHPVERAFAIAVERNGPKSNQTVCRGRSPLEKHFMGAIGEILTESMLGAEMDFKSYGRRGDGSRADGVLPDGREVICKTIGPALSTVWVPRVCLVPRPRVSGPRAELSECPKPSVSGSEGPEPASAIVVVCRVDCRIHPEPVVLFAELAGWISAEEFLRRGRVSDKHYRLRESVPGRALDRDICVVLPVTELRKF
jgi:hypothetical protein